MAKIKRGEQLVCVPCGREVTVGFAGVSDTTIWCCNRPMAKRSKAKSTKKKASKK